MKHYFVTGATGVVGSAVVRLLFGQPETRMTLLVRAHDDAQLKLRFGELLSFLEMNEAPSADRIRVIRGDVEIPRFGLKNGEYVSLSRSVTRIVHCAASVRMNLPLAQAIRSAVTATENVLRLAEDVRIQGALEKVEIVSTVGVGGVWHGLLPERWIHEPRRFHNTYEEAKARAEVVVEDYVAGGMPITVHRPSMIVGDSRTGRVPHFQIFYHLVEFIAGHRTFGLLPPLEGRHVDLVPVDYVAQAIAWSSSTSSTIGSVLHLCSGPDEALGLNSLKGTVRSKFLEHGLTLPKDRIIPVAWFRIGARLVAPVAPRQLRGALRTVPVFLSYLDEDQRFDNSRTADLLVRAGVVMPDAGDFLNRTLDYYLEQRI